MKTKHTPGPWIENENYTVDGKSTGTYSIWTNEESTHYIGEITFKSNARLIAAAPGLLAALEFVNKWIVLRSDRGDNFPSQLTNTVSAAIAKATGQ